MGMYTLTSGQFLWDLKAVDNQFIRQVYTLAVNSARNNKIVSVVTKDVMSNRGEVASRGISAGDKSVLDLCKFSPLIGLPGAKNVMEEVAQYRWNSLGLNEGEAKFAKNYAQTLFIDYLLASSLCYVEVFDSGSQRVDKFFATRNRFIAGGVAGIPEAETNKFVSYLTPAYTDYKYEQLKVLKLSQNKKGFKITQPRSALALKGKTVRITPLFLISAFFKGIVPSLKSNILKFTYIKDNSQEREFVTTLSPQILSQYYDNNFVQKMLGGCEAKFDRGYIRLPELGCSKYDETGVRALNLSRITSISVLPSIDASYIDVDFSAIMPSFKKGLNELRDINAVSMLYSSLLNEAPQSQNIVDLKSTITAYVDGQFAIGTTTFLRFLHRFMVGMQPLFPKYTGKPTEFGSSVGTGFNLGVAD